jgi:mevalonate kinase
LEHYYAHGKLLLTGEYVVLDGAKALALPTKLGQRLIVAEKECDKFNSWTAYLPNGKVWFKEYLCLDTPQQKDTFLNNIFDSIVSHISNDDKKERLYAGGYAFETILEFEPEWGLGSSSTLVSLLSQWSSVDPYQLLADSFGGSGYDIASATAHEPIYFQKLENSNRTSVANFNPKFKDSLYFIFLGIKQNSREGIRMYKSLEFGSRCIAVDTISSIADTIVSCENIEQFNYVLIQHETTIATLLSMPTVQATLFDDYSYGLIKSLGAWGGDFIMATSRASLEDTTAYFKSKGFAKIFNYSELILQKKS